MLEMLRSKEIIGFMVGLILLIIVFGDLEYQDDKKMNDTDLVYYEVCEDCSEEHFALFEE